MDKTCLFDGHRRVGCQISAKQDSHSVTWERLPWLFSESLDCCSPNSITETGRKEWYSETSFNWTF